MGNTQYDLLDKEYDPTRDPIPWTHPANPNPICPCFRRNSIILAKKLEHGAAGEISKSHFLFKRILGKNLVFSIETYFNFRSWLVWASVASRKVRD
jgi:hypothetical protein